MEPFKEITKENLHHANLIISNEEIIDDVLSLVESLGVKNHGNENFICEKCNKFLIEDARRIRDAHIKKTPEGKFQVFVLVFNFITTEAQNALLKMFEEPKERTVFFLITPSKDLFLDTVLSRVNLIEPSVISYQLSSRGFLEMNVGERIKFITNLVQDIKKEKATKQNAIDLLSGLEVELYKKSHNSRLRAQGLQSIIEARKYINLNGASVKILLENVALNV